MVPAVVPAVVVISLVEAVPVRDIQETEINYNGDTVPTKAPIRDDLYFLSLVSCQNFSYMCIPAIWGV